MNATPGNNHIDKHFPFGQIVATPGALRALAKAEQPPGLFLDRHLSGDWGDVTPGDRAANNRAFLDGDRIVSAYVTAAGERIWIITEAEPREVTTILLPEEG